MMKYISLIAVILSVSCASKQDEIKYSSETIFETSEGTKTATYEEVVLFYENLAAQYASISMYDMGRTDSAEKLNLITFNPDRTFESEFSSNDNKIIVLINNGIHPGESDGIDASMMLMRDYAEGKLKAPENVIIAVIPVYNIGGALNRNSTTRTNQNGPEEYGFRGNARNYDLNRDFIKADTKNAIAFADLFRTVDPDIFIDNHVSNGADYQYVLTHLFTQHNKLGGPLGAYLHKTYMPQLEDSLQQKKWDITPYVNVFNRTPDAGFSQFLDGPRYSTGYAALFNTLGFMVETHMLKPYKERVEGTYELMHTAINIANNEAAVIKELRYNARDNYKVGGSYPIGWEIDSTKTTTLNFKGYEGEQITSEITGAQRLKYNKERPFTKDVIYYNHFKPKSSVVIPEKYIIPRGYWKVVDLMDKNDIKITRVQKDSLLEAEVYRIKSYETVRSPYEGHYLHYNTEVESTREIVAIKEMDFIIETNQEGIRYILETLEPEAPDSFFNWNFFDTVLQQKEGFSPYVWEDQALEFLNANPDIKSAFEAKKAAEPSFAQNWYAQLDWIHKQSPNYEKAHLRYPVIRVGG